jgi:hypothetical protein
MLAAAGCGSAVDSRPQKWSYISPVLIQPNCATANCHSQLAARLNVVLDTISDGYTHIRPYVQGGENAVLLKLLRGSDPTLRRMPPDYPMTDVDIALIEGWITAGAMWDGPGMAPQ